MADDSKSKETYNHLLRRVRSNKILKSEIDCLLEAGDVLDMTTTDWEKILQNNPRYQKYLEDGIAFGNEKTYQYIKTQQVKNLDDVMKMVVVGHFSIVHIPVNPPNSDNKGAAKSKDTIFLTSQYCLPLVDVGKAYYGTGLKNVEFEPTTKLYVDSCGFSTCRYCPDIMMQYNIPLDDRAWWCLTKTKVFNGEKVRMVHRKTVERDFARGPPFMAILSLTLNQRQKYGENFRKGKVCGSVREMILFRENSLEEKKVQNVEFLYDDRDGSSSATGPSPNSTMSNATREKPYPSTCSPIEYGDDCTDVQFEDMPETSKEGGGGAKEEEGEDDDEEGVECIPETVKSSRDLEGEEYDDDSGNEFETISSKRMKFD